MFQALPDPFDRHDPSRFAEAHLVDSAKVAASNFPTVNQILRAETELLVLKLQLTRRLHLQREKISINKNINMQEGQYTQYPRYPFSVPVPQLTVTGQQ